MDILHFPGTEAVSRGGRRKFGFGVLRSSGERVRQSGSRSRRDVFDIDRLEYGVSIFVSEFVRSEVVRGGYVIHELSSGNARHASVRRALYLTRGVVSVNVSVGSGVVEPYPPADEIIFVRVVRVVRFEFYFDKLFTRDVIGKFRGIVGDAARSHLGDDRFIYREISSRAFVEHGARDDDLVLYGYRELNVFDRVIDYEIAVRREAVNIIMYADCEYRSGIRGGAVPGKKLDVIRGGFAGNAGYGARKVDARSGIAESQRLRSIHRHIELRFAYDEIAHDVPDLRSVASAHNGQFVSIRARSHGLQFGVILGTVPAGIAVHYVEVVDYGVGGDARPLRLTVIRKIELTAAVHRYRLETRRIIVARARRYRNRLVVVEKKRRRHDGVPLHPAREITAFRRLRPERHFVTEAYRSAGGGVGRYHAAVLQGNGTVTGRSDRIRHFLETEKQSEIEVAVYGNGRGRNARTRNISVRGAEVDGKS